MRLPVVESDDDKHVFKNELDVRYNEDDSSSDSEHGFGLQEPIGDAWSHMLKEQLYDDEFEHQGAIGFPKETADHIFRQNNSRLKSLRTSDFGKSAQFGGVHQSSTLKSSGLHDSVGDEPSRQRSADVTHHIFK